MLQNKLKNKIIKPIFITGLARSGSTILANILNLHSDTGSFLYRDVPFIEMPYLWSFANRLFYAGLKEELSTLRLDMNTYLGMGGSAIKGIGTEVVSAIDRAGS